MQEVMQTAEKVQAVWQAELRMKPRLKETLIQVLAGVADSVTETSGLLHHAKAELKAAQEKLK